MARVQTQARGRPAASVADATPSLREPQIREALRRWLEDAVPATAGVLLIDELGIRAGRVRVDVARVDDRLHGYEIKSDGDSLRRLPGQVCAYGEVLDRATLVTTASFLTKATTSVPAWWGLALATSDDSQAVVIEDVRPPRDNPSLEARKLAELLWHDDALALLRERGAARGLAGQRRAAAWERVAAVLHVDEIRAAVVAALRLRAIRAAEAQS